MPPPGGRRTKAGQTSRTYTAETHAALRKFDLGEVNYDLIVRLAEHLCAGAPGGGGGGGAGGGEARAGGRCWCSCPGKGGWNSCAV